MIELYVQVHTVLIGGVIKKRFSLMNIGFILRCLNSLPSEERIFLFGIAVGMD
jgi:hypothetical protein